LNGVGDASPFDKSQRVFLLHQFSTQLRFRLDSAFGAFHHCLNRRPMPRFRLRTLLIVLALGPLVLALSWWTGSTLVYIIRHHDDPEFQDY
jgi:hypothetical protein